MWLLIFLPVLCGCVLIGYTFFDARENVHIWRGEFQFAMDSQCPHIKTDILGGEGKVYLDAYREAYQWLSSDETITCDGNGKTIQCSCRTIIP